jgi:hypothetical protein
MTYGRLRVNEDAPRKSMWEPDLINEGGEARIGAEGIHKGIEE